MEKTYTYDTSGNKYEAVEDENGIVTMVLVTPVGERQG